ncbi:hypothetical protein U1Q18_036763, partial [Sarracenia purpurea var. burkii]
KTTTEKILLKLKLENYQLGKTKVFLRAGQIGVLDSRRAEVLDTAARHIQGRFRTLVARRDFVSTRVAAVSLQACCRGCLARSTYTAIREAAASILIQKYVRRWILMRAYMQLRSSTVLIQSSICGFLTRKRFFHRKKHMAATLIQAQWRMCKIRSAFRHRQTNIIAIQCRWRQKMAKRELRRLKQEANEAGALRLAKNKLEKHLDDLTWRLQLEKKLRMSNEEAKLMEISKLQKTVQSLILELDAAKLATVNECNKNAVIHNQLELSMKEKSALEREVAALAELRNENAILKNSLNTLETKNSVLEKELIKAKKDTDDVMKKLREVEKTCSQLQQNLQSMEEKLYNLEDENHVLRQKTLSASPKSNRSGFAKQFLEKYSGALALPYADRKPIYVKWFLMESPTPTKLITPLSQGLSDSRRARLTTEKHQENYEFLSSCIKEDLGFKNGKPVAACVIYKCLVHWHAFESERTAIFDYIIDSVNDVLKVGDENVTLPYWLSNASALLCLLQRNLRSNGFLTTISQRSTGSSGLNGRIAQCAYLVLPWLHPADLAVTSVTCKTLNHIVNFITAIRVSDASRGFENLPIPFVNAINGQPYAYFIYTSTHILGIDYSLARQPWGSYPGSDSVYAWARDLVEDARGCECKRWNGELGCPCSNLDSLGLTRECGSSCRCGLECGNRTSQRGVSVRLKVVKHGRKGWGLHAGQLIPRAQFVTKYADFGLVLGPIKARPVVFGLP